MRVLLLLLLALCWGSPAHAETWREADLPHFHFRYPQRWSQAAAALVKRAPKDLAQLQKAFGIHFKGKIRVRLSSPGKAFGKIQPHGWQPDAQIAGLAYPSRSLITMRIRSVDGLSGLHQTFRHELCHILIHVARGPQPVPLWLNEGVAMWLSDDYGGFDRYALMARAQVSKTLPPLSKLARRFPSNPNQRQLAYAMSLDAVLFLQKKYPGFLPKLLGSMRQGKSFDQAIEALTGFSLASWNSDWEQSLARRFGWIPLLANEGIIWMLSMLLFLVAYWRIRKQRRQQLAQLEDEPQWQSAH